MLSDKQSLILCGLMAGGIFATGIIGVLDNYIIKTVLTVVFLIIIGNIIYTLSTKSKEDKENDVT